VESGEKVHYFALNTDGASFEAIRDKRIDLTKQALRSLGLLPGEAEHRGAEAEPAREGPGTGGR
jgi:hypothetical protein